MEPAIESIEEAQYISFIRYRHHMYTPDPKIHYHTPQVYTLDEIIQVKEIHWDSFCENPNAILFFEKFPEKFRELDERGCINWNKLCSFK